MKFGLRTPSLKKRISARTSWKRVVRHRLGVKVPRGMGILTNPKKAIYNKVYNKTTVSVDKLLRVNNKNKNNSSTPHQNNTNNKIGIEISNTGDIIRSSSKALNVTSKNFKKLRQKITDVYNQRVEVLKKLKIAKLKLFFLTTIHFLSYVLIVGFFYKKIAESRKSQQKVTKKLKNKLSKTYVELSFADKSQLEKSWLNCIDSFIELMKSEKIWDITYAEGVNRAKARTIAETATKRTLISRVVREIKFIKSDLEHLFLPNANGPDLFFFPTFLLLFKDNQKFGIFDLKEVKATLKLSGYIEEESVPKDTEIIRHTWKKANKDGSMDRRFKDNRQIPIVKYGDMSLQSDKEGLDESFMFSNYDAFVNFTKAYEHHISLLNKL